MTDKVKTENPDGERFVEDAERLKMSRLESSGFTETNTALHNCAVEIVKKAKELFNSAPVVAVVWPYRYGGYEMISCDLFSEDRTVGMPITISAAKEHVWRFRLMGFL